MLPQLDQAVTEQVGSWVAVISLSLPNLSHTCLKQVYEQ
jgi:hypothetical protein